MDVVGDAQEQEEQGKSADRSSIIVDAAKCFTSASFQNAIPVLRSVSVENHTGRLLENCRLELSSAPAFLRAKTWTIDRLLPGDRLALSDRKVDLDPAYLDGLNEAERGEISLRFRAGEEMLDEQRLAVRLLARDEWGGVADMMQLLPAFVMPNDPGIAPLLRSAADRLTAHGHSGALDGYQSGKADRAFMLAAAIYSAVAGMGLVYAEPPASFEARGQKVRRPSIIAADGLATCLDTTLLLAAAMEAAGLHPAILMFEGHAAVGVWLKPKTFGNAIETDLMEVRKALASREFLVFETTGTTHRPPMTIDAARQAIEHRLAEDAAHAFLGAIDVKRSRSGGIVPLASRDRGRNGIADGPDTSVDLPLPPPPGMDEQLEEAVEEKPKTAAGRIDRWQRKLLDLTLRNRLLNFPDSKKTIPFLCTDVAHLEDRLASGAGIRIVSLPEQNPIGERDAAIYRDVHGRDLQRTFAAEALQRDELASTLEARQLEARLIDLHRQVRNDFAEGGANTLFLAVGFLRWRKRPQDQRSYRAPLLLIPVKLERRSATAKFTLRFHEDEPRFNATLIQFLERDFGLKLHHLAENLPLDDVGVDVQRLLETVRQALRDVPGMEVVDETALSTFSFAKFLMWKDLVERTDALRQNRVVRHLIDTPDETFKGGGDGQSTFREERDLDRVYAPGDIVCLLPSDSSQLAATLAAAEGRDFVIVGPPGTGKSQTIANMIANCLAAGKTVLFVAEKTAALDVVYRRLREHGLGAHCIELHSNKADRKHFLAQLKTAWEQGGKVKANDWVSVNERLRMRRDELNAYVEALHRVHPNGWTLYRALGTALKGANDPAPRLKWPSRDAHDAATFSTLENLAAELGLVYAAVDRRPELELIDHGDWSFGWQEELLSAAETLADALEAFPATIDDYLTKLGVRLQQRPLGAERDTLAGLAAALQASRGVDLAIAFDPEFDQCVTALIELEQSISDYRIAERGLSGAYQPSTLLELDLDTIQRDWLQAEASFWPLSFFRKRKVRKLLEPFGGSECQPARDLPLLQRMRECRGAIEQNTLARKPVPFDDLHTDAQRVSELLRIANELRIALQDPALEQTLEQQDLTALRAAVRSAVSEAGADHGLYEAGERLHEATARLHAAMRRFSELSGREITMGDERRDLAALAERLRALALSKRLLPNWSEWCRVRTKAAASSLLPLVEHLEAGHVQAAPEAVRAAFSLAYARWWLPLALDSEPVLRSFRRFQHENAIKDFREIDDLVRTHATARVISGIGHKLSSVQDVPRNSELGMLRHQMSLQRPRQSIRDLIGKMPTAFPKLAPCMLMSPLSIAQYLPPDQSLFDVVIFDEASQITTWDAVGAIARAQQTIIVGDPKQLPPTNFFGRNDEEDDVADHEKDLESILDEVRTAGIPVRDLKWHYRSRSESLIAFSNHHYYNNRLVTFPSPVVDDRAVRLHKVPHGVYDRGKSRTNKIEAEAVAAEAVARMRRWLKLAEKERPTLGIITFNIQQQTLIQDLLDKARRDESDLEWFFAEERVEATIVKNLENVQGDERDVILFSITFWKDAAGKLAMDFGALNRDGGERRLNVAVTRARQELVVFSGFTADQIDLGRTKARGVQDLKAFLDYADRGSIALPAQDAGSQGGFESPFEEAVAAELDRRGWMIVPQVGISGFRIDLGIRHPDRAGAYLAGVECDGASYHSSATARDRDKVREQVLKGLGWNILRVWSTDWWFDASVAAERLHSSLQELLEQSRARPAAGAEMEPTHWDMGHEVEGIEEIRDDEAVRPVDEPEPPLPEIVERVPATTTGDRQSADFVPVKDAGAALDGAADATRAMYRIADLSSFGADASQFFELGYRHTLGRMVEAVIDTESPLRADVLAQRIARAHGWLRTGVRIRERIDLHLRGLDRTSESSGDFLWRKGAVAEFMPYRRPADENARRSVAEIPLAELASVVLEHPDLLDQADPARDLARLLGVDRLAGPSRARLDEAIARARSHIGRNR